MRRWTEAAHRLTGDKRGSITILFGLSSVILMALVGIAIDSSRGHNVKFKVQEALDAAALAAAQHFDKDWPTPEMFQQTGEAYFNAYLNRLHIGDVTASNIQILPDFSESSVTASAKIRVNTYFGFASNDIQSFLFEPTSKVIYKPKKIEISLVLDITGSMCDVPPAFVSDECSSGAKINALKAAAIDLVDVLKATAPSDNAIKIALVPYAAAVNTGSFANAVSGGASTDGCVVERSGAHVYDDASPSWGGYFGVGNVATDPAYSCPTATVLPLTDIYQQSKVDEIKQRINALKGFGGTAGHLGVAWGFYTLSPNWGSIWPYDSRPRSYDPEKTIKTIVLMTDGMFNVSYDTAAENKWPNVNAENSTIAGTSGFQALKICEEARKSGREIRIYAVGFQTTLAAEELLKECAGADNFFTADTAAELSEAFRTIAESLTSMRVSG